MENPVDVEKLRKLFADAGCHQVVALVDYLLTPEGSELLCVHSGTVDISSLRGVKSVSPPGGFDISAITGSSLTAGLSLGHFRGAETPLQSLERASQSFEKAPNEVREFFDGLCGEWLAVATAPRTEITVD